MLFWVFTLYHERKKIESKNGVSRESSLNYLHGLTKGLKERREKEQDESLTSKNPLLKKLYDSSSVYSYDSVSESIEVDQNILDIMQEFLDRLFESIQSAPYSIRWICKQLYILIQVNLIQNVMA
jgi:hypothetical protein